MIVREAFLTYGNQTYCASIASGSGPQADTPVTRLIEGVWDQYPDQAFHLLRSRIYTNYPLTLRCQGAIQLAAKRVTSLEPEAYFALRSETQTSTVAVTPRTPAIPEFSLPATADPSTLADWIRQFKFPTQDRPILALLSDVSGQPVLAAPNSSSSNRLRHAEVNLVREWVRRHHRSIPQGFTLWVSLKPCRMCAGFIHDLSEDGAHFKVCYLEDDPGPKARNSPLIAMTQYSPS